MGAGDLRSLDFEIFTLNFATFSPPGKSFWLPLEKSTIAPLEKILLTPMQIPIHFRIHLSIVIGLHVARFYPKYSAERPDEILWHFFSLTR